MAPPTYIFSKIVHLTYEVSPDMLTLKSIVNVAKIWMVGADNIH